MARSKDQVRLFVGVRVSLATLEALTACARQLRDAAEQSGVGARWVSPATYHVTLKFIGWTRPEAVEAICDKLGEALAGQLRFRFEARGVGAFPKPGKARVVWAGLGDPEGRLTALAEVVESALEGLGYAKEKRPFHPHVTLARIKDPGDVSALLEPVAEQSFSETSAESVVLFESTIKSTGSEYAVVAEWPLGAPSRGRKRQTGRLEPTSPGTVPGEDANGPKERSD